MDREHTTGERGADDGFTHAPVMLAEVVELFAPVPAGVIVDATVGGGGHSEAILDAHPHLRVVGLDRDPAAVAAARRRLERFGDRAVVRHERFDRMAQTVEALGARPVSGVVLDLGVSSHQLDQPGRGFSYHDEGPVDMRMDPTQGSTAADLLNEIDEDDLAALLVRYSDERHARRIAAAIVAHRPISSTTQLAAVVRDAIPAPARRRGGHPARRTFQALRIAVNDELRLLERALEDAIELLAPHGRAAVLSYHSGEDRIVKRVLREAETGGCTCPPDLPCACGAVPVGRVLRRGGWVPSREEVDANPRARSCRLRAIEKLGDPGPRPLEPVR